MLYLAWHVEAFARTKRLPDLGEALGQTAGDAQSAKTVDEIEAVLDRLVERGFAIKLEGDDA